MDPYDEEEESGGGLDLKVLVLYGALRSRGWILLLTGLGATAALLVAAAQPNVYSSEARLQFTPGMAESLSNEDTLGYDDGIRTVPGIEDEIMLLTDPRVYESVARKLRPSWVLRMPDPAEGDGPSTSLPVRLMHGLQSWIVQQQLASRSEPIVDDSPKALRAAADSLAGRIRVVAGRRSQILVVQADAWTPEDAQRLLTVVIDEFVARHNEHYGSNVERIQKDLDDKREELVLAQEDDRLHKDDCGIQDLAATNEATMGLLIELRAQKRGLAEQRASVEAQLKLLGPQLALMPEKVVVQVPDEMIVNPELARLDADITAEREYIRDITVRSPIRDRVERAQKVEAAEAKIADLEQQRAAEPKLISKFPGGAPTREEPNEEKVQLERRIEELKAERVTLDTQLDLVEDEQERALQAQQQAFTCNNIHDRNQRKIDILQGEVSKLDAQVRAAQSIESYRADGESNLRRYTPPDLQPDKTGPKRSKILLAGLFGGGALGCAVALLRQLLERRVRYRETLEGALGLTVLAVVDEHKGLRKLRAGRSS
jgi:uncharacterized protein involved in exopolysaccharide biosynthesis